MRSIISVLSAIFLSGLTIATTAQSAHAFSSGGYFGYAVPISESSCFVPNRGGAVNICAGPRAYEVVVPVIAQSMAINFGTVKIVHQGALNCDVTAVSKAGLNMGNTTAWTLLSSGNGITGRRAVLPAFNSGTSYWLLKCVFPTNGLLQSVATGQ